MKSVRRKVVNRMTEVEKTIKGLELCVNRENCTDCPFKEYAMCEKHLKHNAIALLTLQKKRP